MVPKLYRIDLGDFGLPGIPGKFRFFLVVGFGGGAVWLPEEETLASPEAVEELSKSVGIGKLRYSCYLLGLVFEFNLLDKKSNSKKTKILPLGFI